MENNGSIITTIPLSSKELNELFSALSKAQGEMKTAGKGCHNPQYNSYYADWETVKEVSREPLANNGLAVSQPIIQLEKNYKVVYTVLGHSSGQFIASTWHINPKEKEKKDGKLMPITVQSEGGEVTYIKRYAYASIIGLSIGADDDGNSATGYVQSERRSNTSNDYASGNTMTLDQIKNLEQAIAGLGNEQWIRARILEFNEVGSLAELPASKYMAVFKFIADNGKE